jgi:hypothetical protein
MSLRSAANVRTTVAVIALSVGGLSALGAFEASADATAWKTSLRPPCAEGRALLAARLAYLEARISPEPGQQEPWRTFANAVRASADGLDRVCAAEPLRPESADASERLERMEGQATFGAQAKAYQAIAPVLTPAQRDILSRNIVPSPPIPGFYPPPPAGGPGLPPRTGDMALNCSPNKPELQAVPWGPPPF